MENAVGVIFILIFFLIFFGVIVFTIAGMWKAFEKAGREGWAAIIPIYNLVVMCEISGKPGWWAILCMLPYVSVVFQIIVAIEMAKSFGKGAGFGVGMAFLPFVFYPMLGFGDAEYVGPGGVRVNSSRNPQDGSQYDDQF